METFFEKRQRVRNRAYVYKVWGMIKQRCTDVNHKLYPEYGGRGITVCPEWMESFEAFNNDMGERPLGVSIHRVDKSKGYFKENCKWINPTILKYGKTKTKTKDEDENKSDKRESGFYWVTDEKDYWHIARWESSIFEWFVSGSSEMFSDSDFYAINERKIKKPKTCN